MRLNDVERGGKMKRVVKFLITLLLLFVPCVYFGTLGKSTEMGLILIPSIIGVVFWNFEDLKKYVSVIKMKDIELEFKDIVEEANATIEQLNSTQYTLVKTATELLYRNKFWGGSSVKTSLELVNELYNTAKSTNAEDVIHGPIKLAYERLLSEAFDHLSSNIDNDEDRKKIDSITEPIYVFKGNTNMIKDCKSIPSGNALKKKFEELELLEKSKDVLFDNILQFEMLCNIYIEKYGELKLVDTI